MSDHTPKRGLFDRAPGRRLRPELLIEIPAVVVVFVMMVHITANALMRTFLNAPIAHSLEITSYWYMPIVVFLGFIAAQMRGEHVKSDFIYNFLPVVTRRFVIGVAYVVITFVCVGFAWFGLEEAISAFEVRRTAGASIVPAWPTAFLAPLAFGTMTIQFAIASVQHFRGAEVAEASDLDDLEVEIEEARP